MGVLEAAASGTKHFLVSLTIHNLQTPSMTAIYLHMYHRKEKISLTGKQTWSQSAQIPDEITSLRNSHRWQFIETTIRLVFSGYF